MNLCLQKEKHMSNINDIKYCMMVRIMNLYLQKEQHMSNTNKTIMKAQLSNQLSSLKNQSDLEFNELIKKLGFVFA